jgi:tetratricopeptide (TPR) repeat protein
MKKSGFVIGMLLSMLFVFTVLATPAETEKKMSKKAEKLMVKALEAIKGKQTDQAIDLLRQVISLEPENAMVRHNLGVLLHDKGLADEAIASFEDALRIQPEYQNAQLALRQALFEAGKSASDKKEYEKANVYLLKLNGLPRPDAENKSLLVFAQYLLGYNFFNQKQYPQALEFFSKCQVTEGLEKEDLKLYAEVTYFLGMVNKIQGQYDVSNKYFQKYLALYTGSEATLAFFTNANYQIGDNLFILLNERLAKGDMAKLSESAAEILPYLNKALENNVNFEAAYVMLGNCHVYLKDYDSAVQTYQRLIERFPQSQQLKNYQTFLLELQKMQKQAAKPKKKR